MIFSYNWLKEFVPEIPDPKILLEQLTLHAVEVEGVTWQGESLAGIVVGIIAEIKPHPKADRLQLCLVDIGVERVQIVCGGSNLAIDMKVAVAKVGAKVRWHGAGDVVTLAATKIRGEQSNGMICAADEIGLTHLFPKKADKGIVDLSQYDVKAGAPLAEVFGLTDYLIDIDNKSMTHRSDLFCHRGLAREIAAVFKSDLALPSITPLPTDLPPLTVTVLEPKLCPRYLAAELAVTIGSTPQFISKRLQACGIKSISNVVDIANYCMLEYGQPMHLFDADKLSGNIQVRLAKADETIEALDHTKKKLTPDVLIIADQTNPIAVAGVIGGLDSAVTETTTRVILEVANFDAVIVRQGAQHCGVHTDSALRYEKSLPAQLVTTAAARALELLQKYADGHRTTIVDVRPRPAVNVTDPYRAPITVSAKQWQRLTGVVLAPKEVNRLLTSLGCSLAGDQVSPPWYRLDLNIPEDIIEEIVRIYGVVHIPEQPLTGVLAVPKQEPEFALSRRIKQILWAAGLTEVYNYSFYGQALIAKAGLRVDDHIAIANPLSDDQSYARTSLLPRLLETVARNQQPGELAFFEVGHVYFPDREVQQLAVVVSGRDDVYRHLRGYIAALLEQLRVAYTTTIITQTAECAFWNMYAGRQALSLQDHTGQTIGTLGVADTTRLGHYDMKLPVAFGLLSIPVLVPQATATFTLKPISPYPPIPLDLSLMVDEVVPWQDIETVVRQQAAEFLQSIQVFDVYHGEKIPAGKKSISFHMILQSQERTLAMKEVEQWRIALVAKLSADCGVELRAK